MFLPIIIVAATMPLEIAFKRSFIRTLVTFECLGVGMFCHVPFVSGDAQPEMADGTFLSAFLVGLQVRL